MWCVCVHSSIVHLCTVYCVSVCACMCMCACARVCMCASVCLHACMTCVARGCRGMSMYVRCACSKVHVNMRACGANANVYAWRACRGDAHCICQQKFQNTEFEPQESQNIFSLENSKSQMTNPYGQKTVFSGPMCKSCRPKEKHNMTPAELELGTLGLRNEHTTN